MELVYQTKESFLLRYSNKFISYPIPDMRGGVKNERVPVGLWWLNNPDRRQFRGVVFRPGSPPQVNNCLNLWQGWGVEDREGDWGLVWDHIVRVICDGNREFAQYVIRWIAWSIQHPNAPAEVALVLIGQKGTGKGTLVRCLERIFKPHSFQVSDREDVIGKFNGHLEDVVLFIADEAYWGGDKRCVGRLQGMITEPELPPIQPKGFNTKKVPNYLHVVMLAEPGWVVPAGKHERRYAVLSVSDKNIGDVKYFTALRNEIANGGAEAMFHDLRRIDLGDWHPRQIPETLLHSAAIQRQQSKTLPPQEKYYAMLLHEAKLPGALRNKPNRAMTRNLIEDAIRRVPRLKFELDDWSLQDFLTDANRLGEPCTHKHFSGGNGYLFPPLAIARAAWERLYGPTVWDRDVEDWGD
jgi:energy-coupling factor transporter ATP-binding protein EcfA2